jgi:hypothetical protein
MLVDGHIDRGNDAVKYVIWTNSLAAVWIREYFFCVSVVCLSGELILWVSANFWFC